MNPEIKRYVGILDQIKVDPIPMDNLSTDKIRRIERIAQANALVEFHYAGLITEKQGRQIAREAGLINDQEAVKQLQAPLHIPDRSRLAGLRWIMTVGTAAASLAGALFYIHSAANEKIGEDKGVEPIIVSENVEKVSLAEGAEFEVSEGDLISGDVILDGRNRFDQTEEIGALVVVGKDSKGEAPYGATIYNPKTEADRQRRIKLIIDDMKKLGCVNGCQGVEVKNLMTGEDKVY